MNSYEIFTCTKISVIIPTFYRQADLSELFDSILKQTIKPFEVLVVDDTPNDTIKIVCKRYETKFKNINTDLRYLRNPRHQSAGVARNVGIENTGGDIIFFLDSDVILYKECVENILEVFNDNPEALGVQGWIINYRIYGNNIYYYPLFAKIFCLKRNVKNSCKYFEYPIILTKIINCATLHGGCMAFKKNVLSEFRFDENLKKYSYMEDNLLSHSILQKYPNSLFITPYAKIIHKVSETGRMEDKALSKHQESCRKYVLTKLFGFKGLLIYYWQNIGNSILKICKRYSHTLLNDEDRTRVGVDDAAAGAPDYPARDAP